jgi:hypothetical protein
MAVVCFAQTSVTGPHSHSTQAETFHLPSDLEDMVGWRKQAIDVGFKAVRYGTIIIASYPTGQIGFLLCEKRPAQPEQYANMEDRYSKMVKSGNQTTYYHPKLQKR